MTHLFRIIAALLAMLGGLSVSRAQAPEPRIALVIGNSAYRAGALATPANDAGLIAQTLTQAGFDVIGARDLDQDGVRRSFRDFLDKAASSGPDTVAVVYLAGYGLQYAGENFFAPVEATIARDSSVPIEAVRLSDLTRALADLPMKARIVVLDGARANPFAPSGPPLAGGLALVEPEPGSLIAFNAAPGTIAPEASGDYGPYARALAEMMQAGGLDAPEVFARARLRVSELTGGAQTPWDESRLTQPVVFFERAADAPPPRAAEPPRDRALRDLPVAEAYEIALERDTIAGYQEFLAAFPRDPLSRRVEAMLAARREALTWRRAVAQNTPAAYWSYLRRYSRGPHVADARRRLAILSAAFEPPPDFVEYDFDVPPPPPDEIEFVSRPVVIFDETYVEPPPPPIYFLPPPPREYIELPPPRIVSPGFLPVPVPVFLPSARPWRNDVYRQPPPARLPQGVTPRDPGAPPRFVSPTPSRVNGSSAQPPIAAQPSLQTQGAPAPNQPRVQPNAQPRVQQGARPLAAPAQIGPALTGRPALPQTRAPQQGAIPARDQMRLQQQRDVQTRAQQVQQQRAQQQQLFQQRAQQQQQQMQRAQQMQQQRAQQQQMQMQREQQMRAQQMQQQRAQQQQMQMQREQQMRAQQMQQQRAQQQQMQMQREQQMRAQQMQQQQQQRQQQMQQQMQHQREQQQRAQQQQQQQRQQHGPQRNDCGGPGKPPCR